MGSNFGPALRIVGLYVFLSFSRYLKVKRHPEDIPGFLHSVLIDEDVYMQNKDLYLAWYRGKSGNMIRTSSMEYHNLSPFYAARSNEDDETV